MKRRLVRTWWVRRGRLVSKARMALKDCLKQSDFASLLHFFSLLSVLFINGWSRFSLTLTASLANPNPGKSFSCSSTTVVSLSHAVKATSCFSFGLSPSSLHPHFFCHREGEVKEDDGEMMMWMYIWMSPFLSERVISKFPALTCLSLSKCLSVSGREN